MEIRFERTSAPKVKPDESNLGFGNYYTDHMFVMNWTAGVGWHDARIVPFGDITLSPAAVALHYGAEIFEGLKAYRRADGGVQMFRPIENIRRMNSSAERLAMPQIDEDDAFKIYTTFVDCEKDWTPHAPGTSLYLRPFMFSDEAQLGVHTIKSAVFMIIASPCGSYYKEGLNPVSIMIETDDVRAVRGGTGYIKCGGNYAASSRAGLKAEQLGYSQVLWLDGVDRKYIEEVGAMNVMFKIDGKVVTPALLGSILPGVTRKSIIELLKDKGYEVEERRLSVDELIEAAENGKLEEMWGCGTAAVVSPVGRLGYKGKDYIINGGEIGETTQMLYDELTGIQWGTKPDTHNWIVKIS